MVTVYIKGTVMKVSYAINDFFYSMFDLLIWKYEHFWQCKVSDTHVTDKACERYI